MKRTAKTPEKLQRGTASVLLIIYSKKKPCIIYRSAEYWPALSFFSALNAYTNNKLIDDTLMDGRG